MPDGTWLSLQEAGDVMRVSAETMRRWCKERRIPYSTFGPRVWRIRRDKLAQFITLWTPVEENHALESGAEKES